MSRKIAGGMLLLAAILSLSACTLEKQGAVEVETPPPAVQLEEDQMKAVCELATLECYYHNTAKIEKEKKVWWWDTSKKLWIEYSGTVKLGIKDLDKLQMRVEGNTVTIVLPDAEVLSCDVDEASLSEDTFYSETKGLGSGKVGAKEQTEAFQAAQENMLEEVQKDESLLYQARSRAETLLENYVKNIGDILNVIYEVKWEKPTEAPETTEEKKE